jgi:hypothetical protein
MAAGGNYEGDSGFQEAKRKSRPRGNCDIIDQASFAEKYRHSKA